MAPSSPSITNRTGRELKDDFQGPAEIYPNPALLPLANYLEHIIILLTQANNSHNPDLLHRVLNRYFAPRLQVAVGEPFAGVLRSTTREAYAQRIMAYLKATPYFHAESYNTTALVDESKGLAKVFTMNRIRGADNENTELTRESFLLYYFERDSESEEWICVRLDIMRGPGYLGFP